MTFRNDHIFTTGTQNPCVMDSNIPDIEGSPTENLEDSWIPKEYTAATVTDTGFTDGHGKIKSNVLKFRTINMDESSATKTRTFKVYINVTAEISNTNFGLGQLFPTTK